MKLGLVDFLITGHHFEYALALGTHLVQQGHDVAFWAWRPNERYVAMTAAGMRMRFVGTERASRRLGPVGLTRAVRTCLAQAHAEGTDVLHFLYLDTLHLPLWLAVRGTASPSCLVGTFFGPSFMDHAARPGPVRRAYRVIARQALRALLERGQLAAVFVPADHIRRDLLAALGRPKFDGRITVVPNPVIVSAEPAPSQEDARVRLGLPPDRIIFLFFGGLRFDKGPDLLLDAAHELPPQALVVLAGTPVPSLPVAWEREVVRRGLEGRVRIDAGEVPDALVRHYFAAADAVVLPYRPLFQGSSAVLKRAVGAGKPLIVSDVGDLGEVVRRHGLGFVITPEDPAQLARAMEDFVAHRDHVTHAIGQGAAAFVDQFLSNRTQQLVLTRYQELLPLRSPAAPAGTGAEA